jgi:ATP-dependent DNA helicase DinG
MVKTEDWIKYFPFSAPREEQVKAINFALDAYTSGKRHVVLSCGTGVGKSAIGVTVARWLNDNMPEKEDSGFSPGAYFLTTQKILQEQYMRDFSKSMRQVMSSANYNCKFQKGHSCAEGQRMLKVVDDKASPFYKSCSFHCLYKEEKRRFIESHESVTNFSYFMAETNYSGKLIPRGLLVVDEAHNADLELSKFVEIIVSEKFSTQVLKLPFPEINTQKQAYRWIKEVYDPKLKSHVKHLESTIAALGLGDRIKNDFIQISRQYEMLDKHMCKLLRFMEIYDEDNWVFNSIEAQGQSLRKLEFKPVDVSTYAEPMLFRNGRRSLMMSATILNYDAHRAMLGLDETETAFLEAPSPFPIDNRPIFHFPIGNMSQGEIDRTLPKLAEAIKSILEQHPNDKGVIHAHSYKVVNYIKKHVKSKRILSHDSNDRDEVLRKHLRSKTPTVLLSPSMTEGVDLRDDASRFQVICKVPYPYLGDKLVTKRMHKWKWWYPLQTAKVVVQSVGRSVRSETDHAVTYILDSNWGHFYSKNRNVFPEDFRNCLKK